MLGWLTSNLVAIKYVVLNPNTLTLVWLLVQSKMVQGEMEYSIFFRSRVLGQSRFLCPYSIPNPHRIVEFLEYAGLFTLSVVFQMNCLFETNVKIIFLKVR